MDNNHSLNHKKTLDNLHIGIIIHGKETEIIYANTAALKIMDMTWTEITGQTISGYDWHFIDKYKKRLAKDHYPVAEVLASGKPVDNFELGVMHKGNIASWILCNAYPEFDEEGLLSKIVVTLGDITHKHQYVPFKKIVDLANDVIIVTEAENTKDIGHKIIYVNEAFTKLTGYSRKEAIGKTPKMLQGELTSVATRKRINSALAQQSPICERIYNYSKTGSGYWLDMNIMPLHNTKGELLYFAGIERDITKQQEKENNLIEQASIDELTGLLNRRAFTEAADNVISNAISEKNTLMVAMIDADHFKKINDNYGHDIGDQALCQLSAIMQSCFRKSDLLGRFGGEEFVVVIAGCDEQKILDKMNQFREQVSRTLIEIATSSEINLTISIGIAFLEKTNNNFTDLIKAADIALYQAKDSGRNKVCVYDS